MHVSPHDTKDLSITSDRLVVDAYAGYLPLPHGVDAPFLIRPHVAKLEGFVLPTPPPPAVLALGLAVGIDFELLLIIVIVRRPEPRVAYTQNERLAKTLPCRAVIGRNIVKWRNAIG